jgi:hypothetical protein
VFVVRLLSLVVKFGLAAAVIVGGVYVYENWESWDTSDSGSGPAPIDYNCGLPGCGRPWLHEQNDTCNDDGRTLWDTSGPGPMPEHSITPCTPYTKVPWRGWFWADPYWGPGIGPMLYVPIDDRDKGGITRNWREVYAAVCAVHPQLGGSGLTPMSADDRDAYGVGGNNWYVGIGPAPSGKDNIYDLPVLSAETLDILTGDGSGECGASQATVKPTPTRHESPTPAPTPQNQRWKVSVSGWLLEELDPYWAVTHGRFVGGVNYDWNLQAEVVLRKHEGKWVYQSGVVTYAAVTPQPFYLPEEAWDIELPLVCNGCDGMRAGRRLTGELSGDGDLLRLSWGQLSTQVTVTAMIKLSCTPQPDCSKWKDRDYSSARFLQILNSHWFNLKEGVVESEIGRSPQGVKNLSYTVVLTRLDK